MDTNSMSLSSSTDILAVSPQVSRSYQGSSSLTCLWTSPPRVPPSSGVLPGRGTPKPVTGSAPAKETMYMPVGTSSSLA